MAEITRPEDMYQKGNAGIDTGLVARSGSSATAIGEEAIRTGRRAQDTRIGAIANRLGDFIAGEGAKLFEQSKAAYNSIIMNETMVAATDEFNQAVAKRMQTTRDKDGKPTFQTLPQDIGAIGREVANKHSSKFIDPELTMRFNVEMSSLISSSQLKSLREARKQEIGMARQALDNGMASALSNAVSGDLSDVPTYEGQGISMLQNALRGGVITKEEYAAATKQFIADTRTGSLQKTIDSNPGVAEQLLQTPAEQLQIPLEQKAQLLDQLEAKKRDDIAQAEKSSLVVQQQVLSEQGLIVSQAESMIRADALKEADLVKLQNRLLPKTYKRLQNYYKTEAKKQIEEGLELSKVSGAIATGAPLDNFSGDILNKHFQRSVESMQVNMQKDLASAGLQRLPLSTQAEIASIYRAPLGDFSDKMNTALLYGSAQEASDAMSGFTLIRDRKSVALAGNKFTSKAEAIASSAEFLIERGGLSPQEAINRARAFVLPEDKDAFSRRRNDFKTNFMNEGGPLSDQQLKQTVIDTFELEPWFSSNADVGEDVLQTFKGMVEQSYFQTGEVGVALNLAKKRMQQTHGVTEINGKKEFMFAPPSQVFQGYTDEMIRKDLEAFVAPVLPEGVLPSSVIIKSDRASFGVPQFRVKENGTVVQMPVSYALAYRAEVDGDEVALPLVSPITGELLRYAPDIYDIDQAVKQQAVAEAMAQQEGK